MYSDFEEGIKRLANGLGIESPEVKEIDKYEKAKVGLGYLAEVSGYIEEDYVLSDYKIKAELHVTTDTDREDPKEWNLLKYSLTIKSNLGITHHFKFDRFRKGENPPEIWKWVSEGIQEFHEKKNKDKLKFMLGENSQVYGASGTWYGRDKFGALLKGMVSLEVDDIIVYRIGYVGGSGFQAYSHAILFFGQWLLFRDFGGKGSGGAEWRLEYVNEIIEKLRKYADIHLIEFHVDHEYFSKRIKELDPTVSENEKDSRNFVLQQLKQIRLPDEVEDKYKLEVEEIEKEISEHQYMRALRDLRAVMEDSGEYLCKINELELPEKRYLKDIIHVLIENKIIYGRLKPLYDGFYSIASEGSHKVFLKESDQPYINEIQKSTINLGKSLLLSIWRKIQEIKMVE